jgi:AIPR protein
MRDELFADNVRDYAGASIGVNNAIAETLAQDTPTEFWWLNNGITLIADGATDPVELEWVVTNPLIVNGLQTSNVIHAQSLGNSITNSRLGQTVLVRLITESEPDVREAIIAGTNNQTAIASIQLHANEEKQLRIEEYLRSHKWYYERRRYQYRGKAIPASRIRTVTDVAQAVMAYRLLDPDTARARPGSLLGTSAGWKRVFSETESEELFLKAVKSQMPWLHTSGLRQQRRSPMTRPMPGTTWLPDTVSARPVSRTSARSHLCLLRRSRRVQIKQNCRNYTSFCTR